MQQAPAPLTAPDYPLRLRKKLSPPFPDELSHVGQTERVAPFNSAGSMSPQRLWIAKVGLESQLCDLCTGIEGESQAIAPSEIPRLRMSFTTSTCARIGNCPGATVSKSGSGNSAFGSRSWSSLSPESGASNQIYQQCNTAQHKHGSQLPLLAAAT